MKIYNHTFNDGQIVFDKEYKEVFSFSDKTDGIRAQNGKLTIASPEQKEEFENQKEYYIKWEK